MTNVNRRMINYNIFTLDTNNNWRVYKYNTRMIISKEKNWKPKGIEEQPYFFYNSELV